ncbi:hypothetical protein, partial [Escherichia coli]|uniref:hypothetical protein n=1 Tax=Escherichia coli TaxID=562 RepID=UPI00203438A9
EMNRLPMLAAQPANRNGNEFGSERDILYKLFFDMKKDVTELKKMFFDILQNPHLAQAGHGHPFQQETILSSYPHHETAPAVIPAAKQPLI